MSNQFVIKPEEVRGEYDNIIRDIVSEQYQDYTNSEMTGLMDSATENLSENEAKEFWGALASLAVSAAPSIIKGVGGLFKRKKRRKAKPRYQSRFKRRQQKGMGTDQATKLLVKMMRNRNFLKTLSGKFINSFTGKNIGKTKTRIVIRRGRRKEVNDISFEAYMNALGYLAKQAAGDSEAISGRQEYSYLTDENGRFSCNPMNSEERAEALLEKLFNDDLAEGENGEVDDFDLEFNDEEGYMDEFDDEHQEVVYSDF